MESKESLYKGGLILLFGFLIVKAGGFIFKIICMYALPVSAYGEVAVFLVLFNWLVLFATFNVTIGLARFVSKRNEKKDLYFASSLFGSLFLSIAISVLIALFTPLLSDVLNLNQSIIQWAVASVPFAVIYNIGIFYYRGQCKMKSSVKADFVMTAVRLLSLVSLLGLALSFAPYFAFLISFIAIDLFLLAKNRIKFNYTFTEIFSTFKIILLFSFPVFLSEFLRMFSIGVDRLLLTSFFSTIEAGFYDVGVSLCLGYIIIASSYSNALLPHASSNMKNAKKRSGNLRNALKASTGFFVLYSVLLLLFGRHIINLINPVYLGVFEFLPFLGIAYVLIGYLTIFAFFANSIGKQKYSVYAGIVFAFLNLSLNLYLIPELLYWGAVLTLVISSAISLGVMMVFLWSEGRMK